MTRVDGLKEKLEAFLASRMDTAVEVRDLQRLPGGASRETWSFLAAGDGDERRLILRRDPPTAPRGGERKAEFELLERAAEAGVTVPRVLWMAEGEDLVAPAFVMEHVAGETIARRILRDSEYAKARAVLASQCGEALARIHAMDVEGLGFDAPSGNPAAAVLEQYRSLLDTFDDPHPAFELGLRWLERRVPDPGRVTLVHGDFRNGNLIVGPDGLRAVLDWELAHLGDPWEDLAWICTRSWRFGGPGEVGGFGDRDELYAAYERTAGVQVDREAVHWWEVMSNVKWGVMCKMQAFTHLWGHVRSLELAAIGRRSVETEYDLLTLLREGR